MWNPGGALYGTARRLELLAGLAMGALLLAAPPAHALLITPTFDSSITSNPNAVAIEGAINSAIATIDGLYSNPVTVPVTFTYYDYGSTVASSSSSYYYPTYDTYVNLLKADSLANPENTVLATAIANLAEGNDANGALRMAVVGAQLTMLGITANPDATVNLNSVWGPYSSFTTAVTSSQIDAIGGIEHELDEILGGGGGGSGMNMFYDLEYGPTDLYRYSAPGTPSYTMSNSASSYLSVDGGATSIARFNQDPLGDMGDFYSSCGSGQLIQSAFLCSGPDEAYTTSSPEFAMMEAIGWNPIESSDPPDPVPEPSSLALFSAALLGCAAARRRRRT